MPDLQAVKFELTTPTDEQLAQYGNQSIGDTQTAFNTEFERVYDKGHWSRTFLPTGEELQKAYLERHDNGVELAPRPYRIWSNIKELHVRRLGDTGRHNWWATALVLRSTDLGSVRDDKIYAPVPSLGISYYVQLPTIEHEVETPEENPLLAEFGLVSMVIDSAFEDLKAGTKEVFNTGDIVEERAPEVKRVKGAFGLITEALKRLPDGKEVDTSGYREVVPSVEHY